MAAVDYRLEAPELIRDFLQYHETIKNHSKSTNIVANGDNFIHPLKLEAGITFHTPAVFNHSLNT